MRAALLVIAGLALVGFIAVSFILPQMAGTEAKEAAQAKGVTPELILASGPSPAEEIVDVAKKEKADLIVIGSRGLGGKTRSFIGSTASKVVTYSPCSVLVVKTQED